MERFPGQAGGAEPGLECSGGPGRPLTSGCCLGFWTRGRRRRFWRLSLAEFKPRPMASRTNVPGAVEVRPRLGLRSTPLLQLPLINPGRPRLGPVPLRALPQTCPTSRGTLLAHLGAQLGEAGKLGAGLWSPLSINSQGRKVMLTVQLLQLSAGVLPARSCASTFLALLT